MIRAMGQRVNDNNHMVMLVLWLGLWCLCNKIFVPPEPFPRKFVLSEPFK